MPRGVRVTPSRPGRREGWDDDEAWASNSDDDEFVTRVATEPVSLPAERHHHYTAPAPSSHGAWTLMTSDMYDVHPADARSGTPPVPYGAAESTLERSPHASTSATLSARLAAPRVGAAASASQRIVSPSATTDDADGHVVHWAERSIAMTTSPHLDTRKNGYLEAVVEDPLNLLPKSKMLTYTMSIPAPSQPATPKQEEPLVPASQPTEDVAQSFLSTWVGAAAFDPIATMNDGVFTTPMSPETLPYVSTAPKSNTTSSARNTASNTPLSSSSTPASGAPPPASRAASADVESGLERRTSTRTIRNRERLEHCLQNDNIDLAALRSLAWKGVPPDLRPIVWPLLLGYLPATSSIRTATLARKRAEYMSGVGRAFAHGTESLDRAAWHQIRIDVPRTNPGLRLWQQAETQRALERILYVWAIRHPASGYVQGINDLVTPFFEVFLSAYIDSDPETFEFASLPLYVRQALEADTFWCMSKLLDGIQDNYIFAQPGILRQLSIMADVVKRIDAPLHEHLAEQGVEYMQFSFRWMNCLLMREMSVKSIIRIWDTYLAEGADSFSEFHPFVCAVFLHRWRKELLRMDFQAIIMFLQSLPTQHWSDHDAEMLLSEAFMYKSLFGNSAHIGS